MKTGISVALETHIFGRDVCTGQIDHQAHDDNNNTSFQHMTVIEGKIINKICPKSNFFQKS